MISRLFENRWQFFILSALAVASMFSCAERARKNPFDVGGERESPLQVELSYQGRTVVLSWSVENLSGYTGFRVYRAVDSQEKFQQIAELPPDKLQFSDVTAEFYHWYYYYVTVLSPATESLPSNTVRTYPGPGEVWVLSNLGFEITKYSYDLIHELASVNTPYPAVEWSVDISDSLIWLVYGTFARAGRINLKAGYEDIFITSPLKRPVDVIYNSLTGQSFFLDAGLNKIWTSIESDVNGEITLFEDTYQKMKLHTVRNEIYVLGENNFVNFSVSNPNQKRVTPFPGFFTGKDLLVSDDALVLLAAAQELNRSAILVHTFSVNQWDTLYVQGFFTHLAFDDAERNFYAAEEIADGTNSLVKLSGQGVRLFERNGFLKITDIQVNKLDQSIVVVDRFSDRILLFDKFGNFISEQNDLYDPIRAYIQ